MSATAERPSRDTLRAALRSPILRVIVPIVIMLAGFAIAQPRVVSPGNLLNIAVQASYLTILAAAQILVLLTRGFDLSIGMTVSLVSVVAALAMTAGGHAGPEAVLFGIAAGLGTGAAVGAINGALVSLVGVNPFVVTLGMFNILLALSSIVSSGFPVQGLPAGFLSLFGGTFAGVPVPVAAAVLVVLVVHLILGRTVFGRSLYLIGSSPAAARVAGVRTRLHLWAVYVLCSGLGAFGALLLTARTQSGEPNLGGSLALQTIAAAVIGGTRLQGGEGSALSAVAGALFVTVLSNGMDLVRVDSYIQQVCVGAIILASLVLDRWTAARRS